MKKKTTTDALEIMDREFFEGKPERLAELETTPLRGRFSNCARGRIFPSVNWRSWWELPRRSSADSKMPITRGIPLRCSTGLQPHCTGASKSASFRCGA